MNIGKREQQLLSPELLQKAIQAYEREKSRQKEDCGKSIAQSEEESGHISLNIVWNDYKQSQNGRKIPWLFDVQNLFGIQLPKMPREYIARLVFDRSHRNLIIHKQGKGIIAGICYRPFPDQCYAEIVFCAVTADEQVKGYGTHMMNHLKDHMVHTLGISHLLTYADEFAIGYFIKQDFITEFALPPERFRGYIKEYQGATLMYCQLHPKMIYVKAKQIYNDMRQLYVCALREKFPNFGREFDGLGPLIENNGGKPLQLEQIPGLETLSNTEALERDKFDARQVNDKGLSKSVQTILQKLRDDKHAWPFREPVDRNEVPDYYEYIAFPIDLTMMASRAEQNYYTHERMFIADLKRLFDNCYTFNVPDSQYYHHGYKLNELCLRLCRAHFPHSRLQPTLPETKPEFKSPPTAKR